MPCYSPMRGYKLTTEKTNNGKSVVIFNKNNIGSHSYVAVDIPCGQCIGCRIDKSRQWAVRCVHEASLYNRNCFITLTYDDEHIPECDNLEKSDFQKFMKRLRKEHGDTKARRAFDVATDSKRGIQFPIRYFHCGEYGTHTFRPHYHACLFNFDFDDKVLYTVRDNNKLYVSPELQKIWKKGQCTVGALTWQTAAYCARYIMKKQNGPESDLYYAVVDDESGEVVYLEKEYCTMSRRPGIGQGWYEKYGKDLTSKDYVTIGGKKFHATSYYDSLLERINPEALAIIKSKRKANALKNQTTLQRKNYVKKVKELQLRRLKRQDV